MSTKVLHQSELKEREPVTIKFDDIEVGFIRVGDKVNAFENRCAHQGGPVCMGNVYGKLKIRLDDEKMERGEYEDQEELTISCPWHGFEYSLDSGVCVADPQFKIRKFNAYIKDDHVYVDLDS